MNEQPSSDLIDEADLRSALLPWRPDPDAFAAGVRQHIEQAQASEASTSKSDESQRLESDWLQTAAAVIPLPLIGNAAGGSLVKLGQLSLGKKLVAWAALPATGLLLMLAATLWAIIKIRRAQSGQATAGEDVTQLNVVLAAWWRQFGVLTTIISAATLFLMLTGYAMPVFVIFLLSGMAMVGLINRLSKAGLVNRRTIAGALSPGLLTLVQITLMTSMFSHGFPFLDQMLIPAVLIVGALVMTIACEWTRSESRAQAATWTLSLALALTAGWFSSTLWNPVTVRDLKAFVEEFDHAEFSSASWQQWHVPAEWLQDNGIEVDFAKPRALAQAELAKENPNPWVLCHAIESGLLQGADLERVPDLDGMRKRAFDTLQKDRSFVGIGYNERILVHALVMRGQLSETDRDFLAERLTATMERLKTTSFGRLLEDQLTITKLCALIQRPINLNKYREFIFESLVSHQCLGHRLGRNSGGFTMSKNLQFSDDEATEAAIELMQIYGVPSAVRLDALRSYLRPSSNDSWFGLQGPAYVRATGWQRFQSLPGVKPPTWQDYFRYEQNLIMAILFTSVCVLATLGAKK